MYERLDLRRLWHALEPESGIHFAGGSDRFKPQRPLCHERIPAEVIGTERHT